MSIKKTLKAVRASRPFNQLITGAFKGLFAATGYQSEFVMRHLPRTGITQAVLPNGRVLKMDSTGEDWIPTRLFWRGWSGYEPETVPIFYRLAEQSAAIFDVGAHIGIFSLLGALANPAAKVFAFEPLAQVYRRLEHNVAVNDLRNIKCFQAAAGNIDGVQEFYFPEGDFPAASSLRDDRLVESFRRETLRHVPVRVVTLDQVVAEQQIAAVGLIKLDTERTEHEVLAGCRQTLARDKPDIICEVWPDADNQQQLEDILRPLGYRFYHLVPGRPLEKEEIEASEQWLNYLFTARPGSLNQLSI